LNSRRSAPTSFLQPGVLVRQAGFLPGALLDVKGLGRRRQALGPPLIILGLAALMFGADRGDGLALQPLKHKQRLGLRSPLAVLHG
jgi:hypothetical protein